MAFNNSSLSNCTGGNCNIYNPFIYNTPEKIAIVLANALIFCLAIPANGIVITVISSVQNVRTPTSTFLLNLCVADVLIASLYIPFMTVDLFVIGHWVFGDFMCKLVSFALLFSNLLLDLNSHGDLPRTLHLCLSFKTLQFNCQESVL